MVNIANPGNLLVLSPPVLAEAAAGTAADQYRQAIEVALDRGCFPPSQLMPGPDGRGCKSSPWALTTSRKPGPHGPACSTASSPTPAAQRQNRWWEPAESTSRRRARKARDRVDDEGLTLTPRKAVDRTTSCSVSGSSHGTAASRSGCSITTTRSGCSGPPASIRPAGTASTRRARVEARLLTIEDEARSPADGVVVKRLAPVLVGELTGVAAGYEPEAITPVIQPLYRDLWQRLACAGVTAASPGPRLLPGRADGRRRDHYPRRRAGDRRDRREARLQRRAARRS